MEGNIINEIIQNLLIGLLGLTNFFILSMLTKMRKEKEQVEDLKEIWKMK